jgi:hypothetical protein
MILSFQINKTAEVTLNLKEKDKIIDQLCWQDRQNLSEKLLPKVDVLLKRNDITAKNLDDVSLKIDMEESYSAYRIAAATRETLRYCMGKK